MVRVAKTKILLVDDHPVFRKGLRALLEAEGDLSVVGEAGDGQEAIALVLKLIPDVVVMDITMPHLNGIEATRQILSASPNTKVMALSIHSGKQFVEGMLRAGAIGYILKDSAPEDLVAGIRAVTRGEVYLSPAIAGVVVSHFVNVLSQVDASADQDELSDESVAASHPILRTKLHRPPVPPDLVSRSLILERLANLEKRPFTLISAPAGYGKSTLASSWLETRDHPHAWLSLDEDHNGLRQFLSYFLSAVQSMFPDACQETLAFLGAPNLPPFSVLTDILINDLDRIDEGYILVLDDYHCIHDRLVHDLLAALLSHPPEKMHLALLTRRDPPLPLSTLRGLGQMNEVSSVHLRFSRAETAEFLKNALDLSIDETSATVIDEKIEGWPTGLRLIAHALEGEHDLDRIVAGLKGGFSSILDYLVAEVLSRQPPYMAGCLIKTAVLDRFCAPLCDVLCAPDNEPDGGVINGADFIAWLQANNLFVIALDAENYWFRYHHLFQQLLCYQLENRFSPEEIRALHVRARSWFDENGFIDEALRHALAGDDMENAVQLVEQNRQAMHNSDRWHVLEKWLSMFPEAVIKQQPELLTLQAWVLYHHFDIPAIPSVLDAVETLLGDASRNHPLRGEIDFFRGYIYYFQNDGKRSLKHLRDARKQVPETYHEIRGQIELLHGLASQMQGQKEEALGTLNALLYQRQPIQSAGRTRLLVAPVYMHIISGELDEAFSANQRLYNFAAKGGYEYARVWSEYLRGLIHFFQNDLNPAQDHFHQAIEQKYTLHTRAAADSMAGLAYMYQAKGRPDQAGNAMQRLFAYVDSLDDPSYSTIARSCQARLSMMQGESSLTERWISGNPPPVENMAWWLEIPEVTNCRALVADGSKENLAKAEIKLGEFLQLNRDNNNICQQIQIMTLLALVYKKQDHRSEALEMLERAVDLSEPGGWVRPFIELGAPMADLLNRLREQSVSTGFIEKLLSEFDQTEREATALAPIDKGSKRVGEGKPAGCPVLLSTRELEILSHVAHGLSNKEIAAILHISTETVKKHLYNTFQKLEVDNRINAMARARKLGILPPG